MRIKAWRTERRAELIACRESIPAAQRRQLNAVITGNLESGFAGLSAMMIGFCWPFRGEFDARFALRAYRKRGAGAALPAVIASDRPLEFHAWWPGVVMVPGVYGIPVPAGTPRVDPDAAIVPMIGFDRQGYRLGYGGGYFDRTLAATRPQPIAIGVSYEFARLPTIRPQPNDVAMDFVVTEAGIHVVAGDGLQRINATACAARLRRLCDERGLPRQRAACGGYNSPPCYAAGFPGYFGADETSGKE